MNYLSSALLAATIAVSSGTAIHAQDDPVTYVLATASTGGTYYPVGVALATLVKVRLEPSTGMGMAAISSAGSGENVRLIREGEAQFGIMQGLYGFYAASGTGPLEEVGPQENLRSVTMLWQNVEHFIVSSDAAATGTMADFTALAGSPVALGSQNSGTIGSNAAILAGLGLDIDADFELVYGGYGPSAEALQNGQVQGVGIPAGIPVGAISQLMATSGGDVTLLNFTEEEIAAADGGRELWTPFTIPAGTYPGQTEDVQTIAQPNFLATSTDVSDEHVYQLTKAIYENLPFLQAIHPATKAMNIEAAIAGLPLPLHPGALQYYQEIGIDVPDRLIAQ